MTVTSSQQRDKNDHYHGAPSTGDGRGKNQKKEWILKIPIAMPASHNYKLKNHWGFMVVSIDWDAFLNESGVTQFFQKQKGSSIVV